MNMKKVQEGSSTPNPKTSVVAEQHKREETEGGGEGSEVTINEAIGISVRGIPEDDGDQAGQLGQRSVP